MEGTLAMVQNQWDPILGEVHHPPMIVGISMLAGGTIWVLTHSHMSWCFMHMLPRSFLVALIGGGVFSLDAFEAITMSVGIT